MTKKRQPSNIDYSTTIPKGPLSLIALPGCEEIAQRVDAYLAMWRSERDNDMAGYRKETYLVDVSVPRFGSGEV